MSLFNKEDVFAIDPDKDYSADLVGDGKKFKDVAALARGKVESDVFIERLQKENQEFKEELQKRLTAEEIMTKITQSKQDDSSPVINPQDDTPAKSLSKEELESIIAQRLQESEAEKTAKANFEAVKKELTKEWGSDWQAKLEAKARELGLGKEWLTQIAGSKPEAFLKIVGVDAPVQKDVSPFSVSPAGINSSALNSKNQRGEKTAAYYENLRKTDPRAYFASFKEQYDQAMKLGEAFFDA